MAGKYEPLYRYLSSRASDEHIQLTFKQIEQILGGELPESARKWEQWWQGWPGEPDKVQVTSWKRARREVTALDRQAGTVTFSRSGGSSTTGSGFRGSTQRTSGPGPISPSPLLNGRYRVEELLGTGAFGRVHRAVDTLDPNSPELAIKELLDTQFATPEEKRDAIMWFKREVGTLLSLDHPAIPAIHSYWTATQTAGPFYLAMDYIPGKTMAQELQDAGGRIGWQQVLSWGLDLCDVLTYLHGRMPPFVFRDLKLLNVMVDSRTAAPVLIDFGIARQMAPIGITEIGTPGYAPFEQWLGKAEPRSDLYALGATLHTLLTGRQPEKEYRRLEQGGIDVETALRNLYPPADALVPSVPHSLAQVLTRATAFSVNDRFADAESMSAALQQVRP